MPVKPSPDKILLAIPFTANNILYVILFGDQSLAAALSHLNTSPDVVFIHITDLDLWKLASTMLGKLSHLGLGPDHGFVRSTPRGPRPVVFLESNEGDYLLTITLAVSSLQIFLPREGDVFRAMLSLTLRDLTCYVGEDPHPSSQHQSYAEFIILLQKAAKRQQDEQHSANAVHHGNASLLHCFKEVQEFAPFLKKWMAIGKCTSPGPKLLLQGAGTSSPSVDTSGPRTPHNSPRRRTYFKGRDLASKRQEKERQLLNESFYGASA